MYDSSQLLNIVNNANTIVSQNYPRLNFKKQSASNPFGPFNDLRKIQTINYSSSSSNGNYENKLYDQMLEELYSGTSSNWNSDKTWSSFGYDANAGSKLANIAKNNSVGFTGYCARYVKNAICEAGLGTYESGNGCDMDTILRGNSNFREIPASTDVNSLPAGCVLVYNEGSQGYNKLYGHTEITDGKGHAYSDGKTCNIRKPDAIFMPTLA